MTDTPLARRGKMLSWRFLHLRSSKAGVLDDVLDAYATTSGHAFRRLGAIAVYDPHSLPCLRADA
jgi:hypothetical protein